jgi:hypothetical protein
MSQIDPDVVSSASDDDLVRVASQALTAGLGPQRFH